MNHALVNKDGKVVNVVWWLGLQWIPPKDHYIIRTDIAGFGDSYDHSNGIFTKEDGRKVHRDTKQEDYLQGKGYAE